MNKQITTLAALLALVLGATPVAFAKDGVEDDGVHQCRGCNDADDAADVDEDEIELEAGDDNHNNRSGSGK
ncbi:MAG TPA: hypothetical protein VFP70_04390 [Burkholderiales bacterium]|nr:hypothetical protein [Burkholderiales bacterium]